MTIKLEKSEKLNLIVFFILILFAAAIVFIIYNTTKSERRELYPYTPIENEQ